VIISGLKLHGPLLFRPPLLGSSPTIPKVELSTIPAPLLIVFALVMLSAVHIGGRPWAPRPFALDLFSVSLLHATAQPGTNH